MSLIGKNIKKIRAVKKLNQTQFASLFNLKRTSVGAYEEGRAEPKINTLIKIANYFSLSINTLLTKELTVNNLSQFDEVGERKVESSPKSKKNNGSTPFINRNNSLNYTNHYKELNFIQNLPSVSLPIKVNITSRSFEHTGDAMVNNNIGIKDGDIIVGLIVSEQSWEKIALDNLFIVILQNRIVLRRVKGVSNSHITLSPDNNSYKTETTLLTDIHELWKVIGVYSTHLSNPSQSENRISDLEQKLNLILKKIEP